MRWLWFLLTSFSGRISRRQFWLGVLLSWPPILLIGFMGIVLDLVLRTRTITSLTFLAGQYPLAAIFQNSAALYFGSALSVKRLHDRNRRALWLQLQLIPIVGSIWLFLEIGFFKGTAGANDWGNDPRQPKGTGASTGEA